MGTTTIAMEKEQVNKKVNIFSNTKIDTPIKYINMAMIIITIFIVIFFIFININKKSKNISYDSKNINFETCMDYNIYKFISDYLKARTDLNYPLIFNSFGRDYYSEKIDDKSGNVKKIENTIKYERAFVKSYNDIKVYYANGIKIDDYVCLVTYDIALGFTEDEIPMIMLFYIEKIADDKYIIKGNLDVGISKFLMSCMKTDFVKDMYNDVKSRLSRKLQSSESIKLAYNSLRQFEINMSSNIDYSPNVLVDEYTIKKLDPIKDIDKIYHTIVNIKNDDAAKNALNEYIKNVVASLSEVQKQKYVVE